MYWLEDNQQPIMGIKDWRLIDSTVQAKLHRNYDKYSTGNSKILCNKNVHVLVRRQSTTYYWYQRLVCNSFYCAEENCTVILVTYSIGNSPVLRSAYVLV